MPTFDFTSPDGKSYSVDGPEGATPDQAFQMLQQHLGSNPTQVGLGEDAAKSIGSGLGNATIGTLGAVGDMRQLGSLGLDKLAERFGVDPTPIKNIMSRLNPIVAHAPTSADIRSTVTDPVVSPDYQPQSGLGSVLKTGAEFAPNMLIGGPEGLAARFGTNVVAPAIGSELGGAVGGPVGSVIGALAGGVGATSAARKFQGMAAARQAAKAIPAGEDILSNGSNGFKAAENMNLTTAPDFATGAAEKMRADLKGFDPETNPVFGAANRLERLGSAPKSNLTPAQKLQTEMNWEATPPPTPASPVAMNDVELIRKELSSLKTSADGPTREAARRAIQSLQESQLALQPHQVINGDAAAYTSTMKNAIGDYAAAKNWQTLQGKRNLAELNLNSPVGGLDMASGGQALQRTMKQLARPVNNTDVPVARKLGFKPDEVAAITKAANGNKLTHLGDVANQVIPHWAGGGAAAAALRAMGGLSVKRQVTALDSLVRSRSPMAAQVATQLAPQITQQLSQKTQALLTALIAADPILNKQSSGSVGQSNTY